MRLRFLPLVAVVVVAIAGAAEQPVTDFVYPRSVAVDARGNIFVADKDAHAVFKFSGGGREQTIVVQGEGKPQTPLYHMAGIAVNAAGNVAVSDPATRNVYRIIGGKPVPVADPDPRKSPFDKPQALAFETTGDLLVPDLGRNALFRVSGSRIDTIATVEAPYGAGLDNTGNILVVSASHRRLMRIDHTGTVTTVFAGAPFEFPLAVAAHPDGSYIVVDGYAKAVFKVTADGQLSTLVKGDPFRHPGGVAVEPGGSVVVVDPHAKALYRVTQEGSVRLLHQAR